MCTYSQTWCSFDGNFANFHRNIIWYFDWQFESSKLPLTRASCSVHLVPRGKNSMRSSKTCQVVFIWQLIEIKFTKTSSQLNSSKCMLSNPYFNEHSWLSLAYRTVFKGFPSYVWSWNMSTWVPGTEAICWNNLQFPVWPSLSLSPWLKSGENTL